MNSDSHQELTFLRDGVYFSDIITAIIFIFLLIALSKYDSKIENQSKQTEDLIKRFKTMEELNDIRLDIRELKRRVFEK